MTTLSMLSSFSAHSDFRCFGVLVGLRVRPSLFLGFFATSLQALAMNFGFPLIRSV